MWRSSIARRSAGVSRSASPQREWRRTISRHIKCWSAETSHAIGSVNFAPYESLAMTAPVAAPQKLSSPDIADLRGGAPQFYIPATDKVVPARRTRTLKQGDSFALFDEHGDISSAAAEKEGLDRKSVV